MRKYSTTFSFPLASSLAAPVSASTTRDLIGRSFSSVRVNRSASDFTGGSFGSTGWVRATAVTKPSASISRAEREPMYAILSRSWAGQLLALGQRRSTSPSWAGASRLWHSGHFFGIANFFSEPSRRATTGPKISGMTSPALRSTTVSPIKIPLAATTSWLCKVANSTSLPATRIGSKTA